MAQLKITKKQCFEVTGHVVRGWYKAALSELAWRRKD